MEIDKIIELLKVLVPVATTIITFIYTRRTSIRHAAKQSILQMIMEDQFNWELFRKFPVNYGNILDEYVVYHKNGGNGEVTKKVDEYKAWYVVNEDKMTEMRKYKCRPSVRVSCDNLETAKKKK